MLVLVHLNIVLILTSDRCMVCVKLTIGSEIILVCLEIVLILNQDRCTVCAKCTIGSKVVLDAHDGSPR
jgi:hypothetical protein